MDNKTIITYLQGQANWRIRSIKPMDKRRSIPRRLKNEITELESMINHLSNDL